MNDDRTFLAFNRDEQKSRPRAAQPALFTRNGVSYLAALDPKSGGSWLSANEFGLVVFLLNHYAAGSSSSGLSGARSRGRIPPWLAGEGSLEDAKKSVEGTEWSDYPPFHLGLLDASGIVLRSWDGRQLRPLIADEGFVTTSSFRSQEVQAFRRTAYLERCSRSGIEEPSEAFAFLTERHHEDAAFNPLMARDDAETHNITLLVVGRDRVRMQYFERDPATLELTEPTELSLALKRDD